MLLHPEHYGARSTTIICIENVESISLAVEKSVQFKMASGSSIIWGFDSIEAVQSFTEQLP